LPDKIEQFCQEYNLKFFYSIVKNKPGNPYSDESRRLLEDLVPFIRQFQTKFVNYYSLNKLEPLTSRQFENRLTEFYSELCDRITEFGQKGLMHWLFKQKINSERYLFPDKPVPAFYQDIMRSLSVLIELFKSVQPLKDSEYEIVFEHEKKFFLHGLIKNSKIWERNY
jgi:hypothetical protein